MAIRKIITIENPILRQKAKKVRRFDPSLQKLVNDMFETMHANNGVGLAGPQIAQSIRVLVAEYEDEEAGKHYKTALFNPEIIKAEGEARGSEGCLSIPGYLGENIRRATKITVKAQDVHGKPVKVQAEGWFARILQHEIDHLDGILFIDRLDSPDDLYEVKPEDLEEAAEEAPVLE
ncbi:methionyl-tRNA formyltransferase/peptide deformylase [Thermosporothrix hazakensis]|jgi:peptide deformylase|uniref:Peptide deformylase n=2 Tax=Thermosporothrix TaxID=768650 RepID=A0A326U028_THEHA|nr:peptide deformylase [Thermosporothrix hazakensis]PZW23442.1 methionyl-tRNA formyltransferase/peptide deformylase [Thermosporothrix hazakensis]BBH89788.1 peptide deformylase [Thermosporothrix sp. COM3]GCE47977.1 peptide deformylase [Thermosporothrix hazakensis]